MINMGTKIYKVIGPEDSHEFTIKVDYVKRNVKRYRLYASNNIAWNASLTKEPLLELFDNGNTLSFNKKVGKMMYHEALYMRILLNLDAAKEAFPAKYKIVEEEVISKF